MTARKSARSQRAKPKPGEQLSLPLERKDIDGKFANLHDQVQGLIEEVAALKAGIREKDEAITRLTRERDKTEERAGNLAQDVLRIGDRLRETDQRNQKLEGLVASLQKREASLERSCRDLLAAIDAEKKPVSACADARPDEDEDETRL